MKKLPKSQAPNALTCSECGENVRALKPDEHSLGIWEKAALVYHCAGSSRAFGARLKGEVHHYPWAYRPCWHCGADLGCVRCSGIVRELLCANGWRKGHGGLGPIWGTIGALCEHGLLVGQRIDDYPVNWRRRYGQTTGLTRKDLDRLYQKECGKLGIVPDVNIERALTGIERSQPREREPGED